MEENNAIIIHTKNKTITVKSEGFDDSIDMDQLTAIDYSNIYAEIITIPALLNKVGLLKAEANNELRHKEIEFDLFEAELCRRIRQKAKDNGEKMTDKATQESMILDPAWKIQKRNLINCQKDAEFIESFYWAVDAKRKMLDNLSRSITPSEHEDELIEQKINTVYIKARERKFKES
jgi:hypothetical protein